MNKTTAPDYAGALKALSNIEAEIKHEGIDFTYVLADIDTIRQALTLAADPWNPNMDEAPRDGSWFFVLNPDSPMCWAPYDMAAWCPPGDQTYYGIDGEFHKNTDGYFMQQDVSDEAIFTHFMIPPAAPAERG